MTLDARVPPAVPRRGNLASVGLGRAMLWLLRWRLEGSFPDQPRFVLVVAPHTSNWDFVVCLAAKLALRLRASWLGKHTLFHFPFGALLRSLGGIPVDRRAADGLVEAVVQELQSSPHMALAISPEGTRRRVERWKSGFYRIAATVGIPLVMVRLDYRTRTLSLGPTLQPTGDYAADLAELARHVTPEMAFQPADYVAPLPPLAPAAGNADRH